MTTRYEVLTYTICDGWINCWSEDDKPQTFATRKEAMTELEEHIQDMLDMQKEDGREADECDTYEDLMEEHRIEEARPDNHIHGLRAIYTGEINS